MAYLAHNKLILVAVAIVIAGGAWYGLSATSSAPGLVTTAPAAESSEGGVVSTLLALRAVKLEGGIFQDPAFMTLVDFSTDIVPEPVGRLNPFAPFSGASAAATTTAPEPAFTPRR